MKTTRTLKLITLTAAIFGFAATSFAQNNTAKATANAGILSTININKETDLDFGLILSSSSAQDAVVTPLGALTGVATAGGEISAASFTVSGVGGENVNITITDLPSVVTNEDSDTMEIDTWTSSIADFAVSGTGATGSCILEGGEKAFSIGATLRIAARQLAGTYESGEFHVTVAFE